MLSFHDAYDKLFQDIWDKDEPALLTDLEKLVQHDEYKTADYEKRGLISHAITCGHSKLALRVLDLGVVLSPQHRDMYVNEANYDPKKFAELIEKLRSIKTEIETETKVPSSAEEIFAQIDFLKDPAALTAFTKLVKKTELSDEDKETIRSYRIRIRRESWNIKEPKKWAIYDAVCKALRIKVPPHSEPSLDLDKDTHPITLEQSYAELFDSSSIPPVTNEIEAKRNILAQINVLLRDPKKCFPYLKHLNEELKRFYAFSHNGAEFPKLDLSDSEFVPIDRLPYLRPPKEYKGISKDSALQQLLLSRFKNLYKLDGSAYKLAGLIEEKDVNKYLKNGVFAVEDRHGSGGLFHGKLSHMLQAAIILLAIEAGDIQTKFNHLGKEIEVSPAKVLTSFVDPQVGKKLWGKMRDKDDINELSFGHPFALNSVVMHKGESFGFPELAHSLADTYVKTLLAQLKLRQDSNPACKNMTVDEFFDTFRDMREGQVIGNFEITGSEERVKVATEKERSKGSTMLVASNDPKSGGHSAVFKINRYRTEEKFEHAPMLKSKTVIKRPGMS